MSRQAFCGALDGESRVLNRIPMHAWIYKMIYNWVYRVLLYRPWGFLERVSCNYVVVSYRERRRKFARASLFSSCQSLSAGLNGVWIGDFFHTFRCGYLMWGSYWRLYRLLTYTDSCSEFRARGCVLVCFCQPGRSAHSWRTRPKSVHKKSRVNLCIGGLV